MPVSVYNIKDLIKCPYLEAFGMLKKAGSREAYFKMLDSYQTLVPDMTEKLSPPGDQTERDQMIASLGELEKMSLAIGSADTALAAEYLIKACAAGDRPGTINQLGILKTRCADLCYAINAAQYSANSRTSIAKLKEEEAALLAGLNAATGGTVTPSEAKASAAALPVDPAKKGKKRGPIIVDNFRKLTLLIDNKEKDAALAMSQMLAEYTYNAKIDGFLSQIDRHLNAGRTDEAFEAAKDLVETAKQAQFEAGVSKKQVLVIDDMPDILKTVKLVLRNEYEVFGTISPAASLKFLMNKNVDILILDIDMPEIDGFSLLRLIRKIKYYATIPAIYLTGNANISNVFESYNSGGDDFIKKPVNGTVLMDRIEKQLYNRIKATM